MTDTDSIDESPPVRERLRCWLYRLPLVPRVHRLIRWLYERVTRKVVIEPGEVAVWDGTQFVRHPSGEGIGRVIYRNSGVVVNKTGGR